MKNIFTFGKYKGQLVDEVITGDPSYVCWAFEKVPENGGVLPTQYDKAILEERQRRLDDPWEYSGEAETQWHEEALYSGDKYDYD